MLQLVAFDQLERNNALHVHITWELPMHVDPVRLEEVFLAASELPESERSAYLDEACGPDVELRAAVDRLLAAHGDPASILKSHAAQPSTDLHNPQPDMGTVLAGRYTLLDEIGEGGMGTVWMARQTEPVKRMVAVKLIKPGMDSKAVLARFEAERQALALMDHPNIARVLDGGLAADGRPFFVMDLVKGVPITQFCDARKLTPRERLELSCRSARRSSTLTRKASFTGTSSRTMCWWLCTTTGRFPR
jgi:eukaryotic-like serine/threonine-protein kinase